MDDEEDVVTLDETRDELSFVRNTASSLASLSGGDTMAYMEYKRGTSSGLARPSKSGSVN